MRIIIKHAPAKGSQIIIACENLVHHSRMVQSEALMAHGRISRFCTVQGRRMLADQIRSLIRKPGHCLLLLNHKFSSARLSRAGGRIIIITVDVFQQRTVFMPAHAGCRASGIHLLAEPVRLLIKCVIIVAFIQPGSPYDDGRMVKMSQHHVAQIAAGNFFVILSAQISPSRDLFKDHKPQLIAAVQEVFALHIVRTAHRVKSQLCLQDIRILLLRSPAHGISHIWIALMTVQADQLHLTAIEVEAPGIHLRGPESHAGMVLVQYLSFP